GPSRSLVRIAKGTCSNLRRQLEAVSVCAGMTRERCPSPNSTPAPTGGILMNTITTRDGVTIAYKDWGPRDAQPVVFHHGWPLSSDDWDSQLLYFLNNGYRVIAHDRRGHGRSTQVSDGHDMDHYADDVAQLVEHLDL